MPSKSKPTIRRDAYAVFRSPNFRYYLIGNFLAESGEQMIRVAVGYEIFQRTHSPMALGLIGLALWLPIFFFMLPGGAVADHYNRKAIVLISSFLFVLWAVGLGIAPLTSLPIPLMYAFLVLTGLTKAFCDPAYRAFLPQLVPEKQFTDAINWGSNLFQLGTVAGPALGGILYAKFGYSFVCWLEGGMELAFFGTVLAIRQTPAQFKGQPVSVKSILSGLQYVRKKSLILATITMDLFVVLFGGAMAMLPAYADKILHCGAAGMGWLYAAPPMGAFVASLILAHRPPLKRAGATLLWAVAGFGLATIGFGLSRWFWLSFLMLAASGALDMVSVLVRGTLVQVLTPDALRGRVNAVTMIFIHSSGELGGFESGVAASLVGLVPSVVLGGVGSVLVVLAVLRIWPEVGRLKKLHRAG